MRARDWRSQSAAVLWRQSLHLRWVFLTAPRLCTCAHPCAAPRLPAAISRCLAGEQQSRLLRSTLQKRLVTTQPRPASIQMNPAACAQAPMPARRATAMSSAGPCPPRRSAPPQHPTQSAAGGCLRWASPSRNPGPALRSSCRLGQCARACLPPPGSPIPAILTQPLPTVQLGWVPQPPGGSAAPLAWRGAPNVRRSLKVHAAPRPTRGAGARRRRRPGPRPAAPAPRFQAGASSRARRCAATRR